MSNLFIKAFRAQEKYQNKKTKDHAARLEERRKASIENTNRLNIKDSQIMQILLMNDRGVSGAQIARELDISPSVVYNSTRRYELFEDPITGAYWFRRTNYI